MPFWGNYGSVNERDSLDAEALSKQAVDMATLYYPTTARRTTTPSSSKFAVESLGRLRPGRRRKYEPYPSPRAQNSQRRALALSVGLFPFSFTI